MKLNRPFDSQVPENLLPLEVDEYKNRHVKALGGHAVTMAGILLIFGGEKFGETALTVIGGVVTLVSLIYTSVHLAKQAEYLHVSSQRQGKELA